MLVNDRHTAACFKWRIYIYVAFQLLGQELTVLVCGDIVSFYALAFRLVLPICRCIFVFNVIPRCRSPPHNLNFENFQIQIGGKQIWHITTAEKIENGSFGKNRLLGERSKISHPFY